MSKLVKLLVWVSMMLVPVTAHADDFDDVRATVQKYLDGTSQGKPELVTEAFLPSLELQYVREGELVRRPGPDYISRIRVGVPSARIGRIHHIDITGDTAAVKLEVVMPERIFTDYLLLLKLKDGWHISNKIATRRPR